MSDIAKSLGRTVKTNIILYSTDNQGRDGYITYNNGGFWKDNIKQIKLKSQFPRYINRNFHSLIHQAAPFNYYSDGRGRDTYVIKNNAGLVKEFNPLANRQILSKYLRRDNIPFSYDKKIKFKNVFLTPSDKENYLKMNEIQNNVVNRLYDQCLDKFREKMKCQSPLTKDSFNSYNSLNNSNNFPNINSEPSLLQNRKNKKRFNKELNNKMRKKILKFKLNRTQNQFYNSKKDNKKPIFESLKMNNISDNNLNNYIEPNKTCKNLYNEDKNNCLSSGNWNPIISKYNSINNYSKEKLATNYNEFKTKKKNDNFDLNQSDLNNFEKNKTMKIEFYKGRPKSYRRFYDKKQIFNSYKPFLVDDFQEFSDYEQ